eukprot:6973637-Pyramimonas_sp.AAC.1
MQIETLDLPLSPHRVHAYDLPTFISTWPRGSGTSCKTADLDRTARFILVTFGKPWLAKLSMILETNRAVWRTMAETTS